MRILEIISDAVFGKPAVAMLLFVGILFTVSSGFFQIKRAGLVFSKTAGSLFSKRERKDKSALSPVSSALSALCATIGTGSIAGVAAAICVGGAGAVFWMWVSGMLSMMTAYAEGVLSIKYRTHNGKEHSGSAMSYIKKSLGKAPAKLYSFFLLGACLCMGAMVQASAAAKSAEYVTGISDIVLAVVIAIAGLAVSLTGTKTLGRLLSRLMPIMTALYFVGCAAVLFMTRESILPSLERIFCEALGIRQCAGGVLGSLIMGCRRGVFSTEAGLGTTVPIHSKSDCDEPCEMGMWGIFEVFVDTFVIGTLTALVTLSTGADRITSDGAVAVLSAFESQLGFAGSVVCALATILFAFASIFAFTAIGKTAISYLTGFSHSDEIYGLILCIALYFASVTDITTAFVISDIFSGLMLMINLAALILLAPAVKEETSRYLKSQRRRDG